MRIGRVITTVDAHAAGEPLRIVTGGIPDIPGATMLERRAYVQTHLDALRRLLMYEPRGHRDMYGCLLTPPVSPGATLGVLFMHNEGYSTMCGHGVIALVTAALETGRLPRQAPLTTVALDTPAGVVEARASIEAGEVTSVCFTNVPSFVVAQDVEVPIGSEGVLTVDLAFGGAFYAVVPAARLGRTAGLDDLETLKAVSRRIKTFIDHAHPVVHPSEPGLRGLYGTIFTAPSRHPAARQRNVTIFADAQVDRSPCGTGTCAQMALAYTRGELALDVPFQTESLIDTVFSGRITGVTAVAGQPAIMPEITGSGHITGFHQFILEETDPLPGGFLIP